MPVGSFGRIALARRNATTAESRLLACQAAMPALNVGTQTKRRQISMSPPQSGFSASARVNAESMPHTSLAMM